MAYKHGSYGELLPSDILVNAKSGELCTVYIGVAPVHQLMDYSAAINKPLLIRSYEEAVKTVGYNDSNWQDFELSEVVYAHFKNGEPIGPIVLINVLNPESHKTTKKTGTVSMVGGVGTIANDKIILKTFVVIGKILGTDYKVDYSTDGKAIIITQITDLGATPAIEWCEVDISKVTNAVVIGGEVAGVKTGIEAVSLVNTALNRIPQVFVAPGRSAIKAIRDALISKANLINGRWKAFCFTDIPTDSNCDTKEEVIAWKAINGYTSSIESPCWPCAKNGSRVFRLSTMAAVETCRQAAINGYPVESPSNKEINITGVCLYDGTPVLYDQLEANALNEKGVKTAIFSGGKYVIWGAHTGAYEYGKDMDPRDKFDAPKLMLLYVYNDFQASQGQRIDASLTRSKVETILNDYQERLDGMPLIGAKIVFEETSNPTSDMVEGDFVFDIAITTAPIAKSITGRIKYTPTGLSALFGGDEK